MKIISKLDKDPQSVEVTRKFIEFISKKPEGLDKITEALLKDRVQKLLSFKKILEQNEDVSEAALRPVSKDEAIEVDIPTKKPHWV